MAHIDLESYFKLNFALIQHHKYSLTEIENMMPWERDIYVGLLNQWIEDENLTLRMKYPSLSQFVQNNFDIANVDNISFDTSLDIISSCIDVVYNADESWAAADCTKKELNEWLETLNSNQFKQVETFFETMPKLSHTIKVTNPKTKIESDVTLEGITSFFG